MVGQSLYRGRLPEPCRLPDVLLQVRHPWHLRPPNRPAQMVSPHSPIPTRHRRFAMTRHPAGLRQSSSASSEISLIRSPRKRKKPAAPQLLAFVRLSRQTSSNRQPSRDGLPSPPRADAGTNQDVPTRSPVPASLFPRHYPCQQRLISPVGANVLGPFRMAGFEVIIYGRFRVITEGLACSLPVCPSARARNYPPWKGPPEARKSAENSCSASGMSHTPIYI
jgi:hypothetical protein